MNNVQSVCWICQLSSWRFVMFLFLSLLFSTDAVFIDRRAEKIDTRKYFQNPAIPIVGDDIEDYKTYFFRNVGTSDFYELRAANFPFVDKSLFIEKFLRSTTNVTVITLPRRWGKSTNMQMLKRFLEIEVWDNGRRMPIERLRNRKLFEGGQMILERQTKQLEPLKIAGSVYSMEHLGKHPVIYISFSTVTDISYSRIRERLKREIEDLFIDEHEYLENYLSDESTLLTANQKKHLNSYYIEQQVDSATDYQQVEYGLRFLCDLLWLHYQQKVYLLVDEFDKPLTKLLEIMVNDLRKRRKDMTEAEMYAYAFNQEDFQQTYRMFKDVIANCLRSDNKALHKVLFTGIARLEGADFLSDINNMREYSILDVVNEDEGDQGYLQFYGFSQEEVDQMLVNLTLTDKRNSVKDWYYGYNLLPLNNSHYATSNNSDASGYRYNPWSVLKCLFRKGVFDTYWAYSSHTRFINNVFRLNSTVRQQFRRLIDDQSVRSEVGKRINFANDGMNGELLNVLLLTGYLTIKNVTAVANGRYCGDLFIPNHEMKTMFMKKLRSRW